MKTPKQPLLTWLIVGGLVYAYFVVFPSDLQVLLEPIQIVLGLSSSISPWLFGLVGVGALSWTALRIWGPRRKTRP